MSTESKHTPEWEVRHNGHYYEVGATDNPYAHINVFHATGKKNDKRQSRREALKMAHLVKAAPAMLAALEGFVEKCLHIDGYDVLATELYNAAQAIKLAKGL